MKSGIYLALGLFFGNWLIIPLLPLGRSFTEGFFIGLIAAVIVLVFYSFVGTE